MNSHTPPSDFRYRPQRFSADVNGRLDHSQPPQRTVSSEALFNGTYEIGINHGGAIYRLKITRQGKLILNK
jgi:hemin uptake protein HemP